MKKVLVTKKGLLDLVKKKVEVYEKLRQAQSQKGEAAEVGGNVWHDNFAFEELERQEHMLNKQIEDLNRIISQAVEVPGRPTGNDMLQIGHLAHIYFKEDNETKIYMIGGYGESDLKASPPVIEYGAPVIRHLFRKTEGTEAKVEIGGRKKTLILMKIELPNGGD